MKTSKILKQSELTKERNFFSLQSHKKISLWTRKFFLSNLSRIRLHLTMLIKITISKILQMRIMKWLKHFLTSNLHRKTKFIWVNSQNSKSNAIFSVVIQDFLISRKSHSFHNQLFKHFPLKHLSIKILQFFRRIFWEIKSPRTMRLFQIVSKILKLITNFFQRILG